MSDVDIIRAWSDPDYRDGLNAEQRASLPANPAGIIALDNAELARMSGGARPIVTTAITCTQYTFLGWKACCE